LRRGSPFGGQALVFHAADGDQTASSAVWGGVAGVLLYRFLANFPTSSSSAFAG